VHHRNSEIQIANYQMFAIYDLHFQKDPLDVEWLENCGRKWKRRRHAKLDAVVEQAVRIKDGIPTPEDVIKMSATKSGMIVKYMTA
jgi:hypothetical protein